METQKHQNRNQKKTLYQVGNEALSLTNTAVLYLLHKSIHYPSYLSINTADADATDSLPPPIGELPPSDDDDKTKDRLEL